MQKRAVPIKRRQHIPLTQKLVPLINATKNYKIIILTTVIITFSFFTQLIFANSLSSRGGKINDLEREKAGLLLEIQLIKQEIEQNSSLNRIETDAASKGMRHDLKQYNILSVGKS